VGNDDILFPSRTIPPPEPFEVDDEMYYLADRVLDSRFRRVNNRRVLEYKILWQGYPVEETTWEPATDELQLLTAIGDFHDLHPDKPRPRTRS
jgi:Chromo (CHRromatin Organisation MOdifier) domain